MAEVYVRPQWTGEPAHYSDGTEDQSFSQCPSCLAFHHASNMSCNGKRESSTDQCPSVLGESRCDRPAHHLGHHEALSSLMRIRWELLDG